jgi:hypothetical protein
MEYEDSMKLVLKQGAVQGCFYEKGVKFPLYSVEHSIFGLFRGHYIWLSLWAFKHVILARFLSVYIQLFLCVNLPLDRPLDY